MRPPAGGTRRRSASPPTVRYGVSSLLVVERRPLAPPPPPPLQRPEGGRGRSGRSRGERRTAVPNRTGDYCSTYGAVGGFWSSSLFHSAAMASSVCFGSAF